MAEGRQEQDKKIQAFEGDLGLSGDEVAGVVGGRAATDGPASRRKRNQKKAAKPAAAKDATPTLTTATRNKLTGS